MTNKTTEPDGQTDRYVSLDDHQYAEYLKIFRDRKEISELMTAMLVNMMDEMLRRNDDAWDLVAQQCGFKDHDDALWQGYSLTIEWPNRRVRVYREKGKDD